MPRTNPNQLAFAFPEPVLWAGAVPLRPLVERLIEAGLVPNEYVASINRFLTVPPEYRQVYPWSLPSRSYMYGVRISDHYEGHDRLRSQRLVVGWESLLEHRYVAVLRDLGFEVGVDTFQGTHACWHHAVDLMTDLHWADLLATRRHTDPGHVANAVSFALQYGKLTVANARTVMAEMGWAEPVDRSVEALQGYGLQPGRVDEGIAINRMSFIETGAWMMIHGLEDGWMAYGKLGHAWMTPEGMRRRRAFAKPS